MVKQCHKPPIWEWFIPPIYGDLGDCLLLFYPHQTILSTTRVRSRPSPIQCQGRHYHAAKIIENDDAFISQIKTYIAYRYII